ncbi:DNA-binding protein OS=Streptomyces cyaneofuscatus OX=66883 GN=G3I52_11020 PE=4 SV=1 [Streptomyces cyaneofuscatus]
MGWVPAGDYEVALEAGKVVCRNGKGRRLKSVPAKLKEDPAVVGLRQLTEWLERHEGRCLTDVEQWMVRSLPVPTAVLAQVWPDPAWQAALRDVVVTGADGGVAGFLRDVDPDRGLGLVDLDGDTVRITPDVVSLPHPVLLDDLDDLREFAVELGVSQRVEQLFREVWRRPPGLAPDTVSVDTYAGGVFKELRFLHGRVTQLGYRSRGGYAVCPVVEDGAAVEEYTAARGLPGMQSALNKLSGFRAVVAEVAPEAVRLLKAHDVVPLLAATLRTGVLDELGWPALDETYAELAAEAAAASNRNRHHRSERVGVTGAWPALILNTSDRAVVVGPEGVLLRHTLRLPATVDHWRTSAFRYVDGELLVIWWEDGKQRGYWSNRPAEVFTVGGEQIPRWGGSGASDEVCVPLPGGGRATGGKALHAGDTSLPPQRAVISDGTGLWRDGHEGRQRVWLEYDPATGTHGRASLPAFLRSGVQDGTRLLTEHCRVLPLQPGLETTPFGTDGTVLGRWVRRTVTEPGTAAPADGHRIVAGTPDGRTVTLPYPLCDAGCAPVPLGALTLPGGSRPVMALHHRSVEAHPADTDGTGGTLWSVTPDSSGGNDAAGTPYVPPVSYWHALRPRDERGSAALRAMTDSRAEELIKEVAAAVTRHLEAFRAVEEYTGPSSHELCQEAVARVLPEVADVRLLAGVTGLVRNAVDRAVAAVGYLEPPEPTQPATPRNTARTQGMFFDHAPEHGDDTTLRDATAFGSERMHGGWWGGGNRWTVIRQILAVNHVLGGEPAFGPPVPSKVPFTPVDGWQRDEYTVPGGSMSWTSLLDKLPELAYRAASSATSSEHRAGLLVLLDTLAAGPLADPAGTVRQVELVEPYSGTPGQGHREAVHRMGQVLRKGGRTVVVVAERGRNTRNDAARWLALDHDPTGVFGPVAGFTLDHEHVHRQGITRDRLTRLTAPLREQGPAPWRPEAAEAFHTATGIGPLQAVALLSAAVAEPGAETLALLDAKTRAFEAAQARLDALPRDDRHALLRALLPLDPADLWTTGPDVRAAAEVWRERLASLVRVPEELDLDLSGTVPGFVDLILNAGSRSWLTHGTDIPDGTGRPALRRVGARGAVANALTALRTLAYTLPYGHALRAHLPAGLAALRHRLADPGLVLDLGLDWTESGQPIGAPIRAALGLPESGGADPDGLVRAGTALLLAPGHGNNEKLLIRPAGLTGPDDPALGLVEGTVAPHATADLLALRALLGEESAELVSAGLPDGPPDSGGDAHPDGSPHPGGSPHHPAQDPTRAVPELVAEAAETLGLSADAAALYLMLLTLPDPTDRNCVRWTEWKPARVKKARAELAATDLVLEAKRSRAGRTLFLPCGWMERSAPALPLETWKEGLYPVAGDVRTVPHLPVPALFAAAWARVRGGDAPAFEELQTRAPRKGRRR